MTDVEEYASQLHLVNDSWVTFFEHLISNRRWEDVDHEQRLNILKMFYDLLLRWKTKPEETRDIKIRIPIAVHEWLKRQSEAEAYPTFNRYLATKLMHGALDSAEQRID